MQMKVILLIIIPLFFLSCSTAKSSKVQNSSEIQKDSGFKESVTDEITKKIFESIKTSRNNTPAIKKETMMVAEMKNDTDEYIDTQLLANQLRTALTKEGFQCSSQELSDSNKSIKELEQLGVKMILRGRISSIVKKSDKNSNFVYYYVEFQIINIATGKAILANDFEFGREIQKSTLR
jgi:Fe-S cluster biosynthesis and repair protein YggX